MKEIWKPVKDFEEYFLISNYGRLKRIRVEHYSFNKKSKIIKTIDRIVKPTEDKGYQKISLSVNGKRTIKYIHRLVAEAFIPNPNNYREVNHKDSNPLNNKVDNLEWCDRQYNIDYMVRHQEQIKEDNERRLETLETIYYGVELGFIKNIDQVKDLIDEELLIDMVDRKINEIN